MAGRGGRCGTEHVGGDGEREEEGMEGVCVGSWLGGSVRVGMDVCWGVLVTPRARD